MRSRSGREAPDRLFYLRIKLMLAATRKAVSTQPRGFRIKTACPGRPLGHRWPLYAV